MKKGCIFILFFVLFLGSNGQPVVSGHGPGKSTYVHFIPEKFSNLFTLNTEPALKIHSGDTVSTETIDAMGFDKNGVKRQKGGNPLTGPFYIENSQAGDVLQITLNTVSLNRPYAYTTETFISRSMPSEITKQFDKKAPLVKWKLDLEAMTGWPDSAAGKYDHLQNFKIPLNPFLGCIGVAPDKRKNEILSFFQGSFGGNMDYSRITSGSTVYLPVFHDGGFLFIGDGHAAQGDGEIAGNALETSLNVSFTVKLIKKEKLQLTIPRIEDSAYIMSVGSSETLENALKTATADLLVWLRNDYQISLEEATQVMSTSIEYTIAEIADPEVIVVAKIKKKLLLSLKK
jgi:acetamidase/formamidase